MLSIRSWEESDSSKFALSLVKLTLQLFGFIPPTRFAIIYFIMALVNYYIAFYFPLALVINLFYLDSKLILISSLSQTSCQIMIASKILNIFVKRKQIYRMFELFHKLDNRVQSAEEQVYLKKIVKGGRWFLLSFACMYGSCGVLCILSNIFSKEQSHHPWFPWDTTNSTIGFQAAYSYQMVGVVMQIYLGFIGDTYLGLLFWVLKGHLKILGMRLVRIGFNTEISKAQNFQALIECIKDHETCLSCYNISQDISYRIMLLQFIFTQCILGMSAFYFIFIKDQFLESFFLFIYFVCMIMEISLCSYCGSELIKESSDFTTALYSCNWMDQDIKFRKVLIIFMQHTQKSWTIWAGGIAPVSLQTWLTVLKATYSFFAVLNQIA